MRKEATIVIGTEGRDKGKIFALTEMPAYQAEKWAFRALQAAVKAGVDIPDNIARQGMAAVAAIGIQALAGMNFGDAEPLLDEMFQCIKIIRDPRHPEVKLPLLDDDIEEVWTRIHLRREVIALHTNFSLPGAPSTSTTEAPAPSSTNIRTSPRRSAPPSPRRAPRL